MTHIEPLSVNLSGFPIDIPNRAILAAALEGRSKSRLVVDTSHTDPISSGAVLVHCHNGTLLLPTDVAAPKRPWRIATRVDFPISDSIRRYERNPD